MHRFETTLRLEGKTATFVEVPLDVPAVFGKVRAPVRGRLNGHPFRSTIMRYGVTYYLPVNRELREGAGVEAGQLVTVELELDEEPRVIEPPGDLAEALAANPSASAAFERLSYTHRREYVEWIGQAKRGTTRRRRIEQTVARLLGAHQEGEHQ